jgi:hypothetical protein
MFALGKAMKRIKAAWGWLRAFTILLALYPKMNALKAQSALCGQCLGAGYEYWGGQDQYEVKPCDKCGQNSQE